MSTTCQTIVSRAEAFNTLNTALTGDRSEMLSRIRADQQALFTEATAITRDRFKTTVSVTSSNAASARTVDLSGLTLPLERVLKLTLSGTEVSQVDELDTDAELSPRYFVRGLTLVEVDDDWGTTGAKTLGLTYAYGPTDIDPDGAYSQTITVPDAWADLLVLPLAMYLCQKDPGRDPSELQALQAQLAARQQAWLAYLTNYGGTSSQRFDQPVPMKREQKQ